MPAKGVLSSITKEARPGHTNNCHQDAISGLITRLHFYLGVFIAPFIFVTALTGTLYALTPQLESYAYARQLYTIEHPRDALLQPLSHQIDAAQRIAGWDSTLIAVRPAPSRGETTRVMFSTNKQKGDETYAVFIDPVTLHVNGTLNVYGTSGILPIRTSLDYLHRNLMLGEFGRLYSELAASWLWVLALSGLFIWLKKSAFSKRRMNVTVPLLAKNRRYHIFLGAVLSLGLLFFSATGLTWSKWAGENIHTVRKMLNWVTPTLKVETVPAAPEQDHSHYKGSHTLTDEAENPIIDLSPPDILSCTLDRFDQVMERAREEGIDADKVEIIPATQKRRAWIVREIDGHYPTQNDAVAIDPCHFQLVDKIEFETFPLIAKLIRWGIDAHIGILFGVTNQIILILFGTGLCVSIVMGYRIWWLRRRSAPNMNPATTLYTRWLMLSLPAKTGVLLLAIAFGLMLPMLGLSLLLLIAFDILRWYCRRSYASEETQSN